MIGVEALKQNWWKLLFCQNFVLEADASTEGLGVILSQVQEDGQIDPRLFYHPNVSAAYGDVWAITHF